MRLEGGFMHEVTIDGQRYVLLCEAYKNDKLLNAVRLAILSQYWGELTPCSDLSFQDSVRIQVVEYPYSDGMTIDELMADVIRYMEKL